MHLSLRYPCKWTVKDRYTQNGGMTMVRSFSGRLFQNRFAFYLVCLNSDCHLVMKGQYSMYNLKNTGSYYLLPYLT